MNRIIRICFVASLLVVLMSANKVFAAASPGLGAAGSFFILSSSFIHTTGVTTVTTGDVGYTTPPAVAAIMGSGTTHVADATYNQAGIDQAAALAYLNSQPCTFNFPAGAINLATDTTHGTVGIYTPGVYCMTGAADATVNGTITLSGSGTYIFRIDGALTTGANSIVQLDGASACDVWWTPTAATTLGANSTFIGTVIDASGISIGDVTTWSGAALAFGGTVTTAGATLSVPICTAARTGAVPVVQPVTVIAVSATATATATVAPALPNTGNNPHDNNTPLAIIISGVIVASLLLLYTSLNNKNKRT